QYRPNPGLNPFNNFIDSSIKLLYLFLRFAGGPHFASTRNNLPGKHLTSFADRIVCESINLSRRGNAPAHYPISTEKIQGSLPSGGPPKCRVNLLPLQLWF
ncbi:MAG TPA: hypothetical protein VFC07_07675, partial [Verrucomicrobiae bacterium]|nr:hypothetical protein [Verrucomicrobiae bacterium]